MAKFRNPSNGYEEDANGALSWLWVLLFGSFYFMFKGIWKHAIISLIAAILTVGLSWLIYPFFAYSITNGHYRRMGWVEVA